MIRSFVLLWGCVLLPIQGLRADVAREKRTTAGMQMDAVEQLRGVWREENGDVTMEIHRPGQAMVTHDGGEESRRLSFSLRGNKITFVAGKGNREVERETYTFSFLDQRRLSLDGPGGKILFRRLK